MKWAKSFLIYGYIYKMKKGLLLLFLALSAGTFSACVNESSSDRLEQEQMAQVLADIHIDEAIIQISNYQYKDKYGKISEILIFCIFMAKKKCHKM